MAIDKLLGKLILLVVIDALIINDDNSIKHSEDAKIINVVGKDEVDQDLDNVFNGVYTECFLHLSYSCLQKKTLLYLKELNNLSEVSVIGDYVKFVKLNISKAEDGNEEEYFPGKDSEVLAYMIDKAINRFFDNHVIKFSGMERQISMSNNVEDFVGRKKRKGGGGGGGHEGGDDGGKKKMMMMAMMCMKMKLMMMVPAMMGMMGMMSFKGMMFSMMSFMISKMMLVMKILEKKGGAGSGLGGGGAGDGGWAAAGGGGGAWMPAGGQDYAGGGGGGYDANGQWQSRSILEREEQLINNKPVLTYISPIVRYSNEKNPYFTINRLKDTVRDDAYNPKARIRRSVNSKVEKINSSKFSDDVKSRNKRSLIETLQNSYVYWISKLLGLNNNRRTNNFPKYKLVNGIKYVYYPFRPQKVKTPKEIQSNRIKDVDEGFKAVITAEDFNKGEIMEGAVESRMNRKKFHKMKDTMNDTIDENPWE